MSELAPTLGQIAVLVLALALAVPFLGRALAAIYTSERHLGVERVAYRVLRVDPDADQHWRSYAMSVLGFSLVSILALFAFGRLQQHLPLSLGFPALPTRGRLEHRRLLRHQHQLAVVLRRGRDRSPDAGLRPHRAELRLGRRRHGRRRGLRAQPGPQPQRRPGRQLLDRPRAYDAPGAAADRRRRRGAAGRRRRRPEPARAADRHRPRPTAPSTSPAARSPRRRRSRSSAPTAAASTTSTPPTRSRTRRP